MPTIVTFGECLKYLINTLDISMSRLAKSLTVDTSLVNRWIHDKRIPPLNSNYIENITDILSKNILTNYQYSRINDFLDNYYDYSTTENIQNKINNALYESQGYSFEKRKKDKIMEQKLESTTEVNINPFDSNMNVIREDNITNLSHDDLIIYGIDSIFTASIPLLEKASQCLSNEHNNTIHLTCNNLNTFDIGDIRIHMWRELLIKVLNRGWKIIIIIKLHNNLLITRKLMSFLYPILHSKKVIIRYFDKYDFFASMRELCIVPRIGALNLFPTKNNAGSSTCCFYLKTVAAVNAYEEYMNIVVNNHTKILLNYYPPCMISDYCYQYSGINSYGGNQLDYYYKFNILALPPSLYEKLLERTDLNDKIIKQSAVFFNKQVQVKKENLQLYRYYDIQYGDSLNNLVNTKKIELFTLAGPRVVNINTDEIIECYENIIKALLTYPNYHMAIIHQNDFSPDYLVNCYIKERYGAVFELYTMDTEPIRYYIDEPLIVRAIEDYYKEQWSFIAPVYKDKIDSITYLNGMIHNLKNQ